VNKDLRNKVEELFPTKLCVTRSGQACKTRVFTVVPGFGPNHNLGVFNNTVSAVERAFVERYFLCKHSDGYKPAPTPRTGNFRKKWFKWFIRSTLSYMPHLPVLTYQETLNLFPATKRKVYEKAFESLSRMGPVTAKDARLSSFVKFEKQDVSKAPRIINPRSPRYNLEVARYLKHFEHHLFTSINRAFGGYTDATVIKGFNADRSAQILRQKWDRFKNPIAIGLDATKFDMHVSVDALRYEHSFYNDYWNSPELKRLLKMQLRNEGVARCRDGEVKFSMAGTRCSGDVNTSLGNCILMCAMVFAYSWRKCIDLELANNGDDCVVFMDEADEAKFRGGLKHFFLDCGFVMTVEETCHEFEQIEFCQTHPVKLGSGWRMIRNPATCLIKDVMCLKPVQNDKCFKKWLYAVGTAGCSLNSGVPVLQEFYRALKRNGVKTEKFRNLISAHRFASTVGSEGSEEVTDEARASFYFAFGLTPPMQVAMESVLTQRTIGDIDWTEMERDAMNVEAPGTQILTW